MGLEGQRTDVDLPGPQDQVTGGATWRSRATSGGWPEAEGEGEARPYSHPPIGHQRLPWPETSQKPTDMGALEKPARFRPPELSPQTVRNGSEDAQGQD